LPRALARESTSALEEDVHLSAPKISASEADYCSPAPDASSFFA
jgi:hypothetical protein